jgi:hypothetical protein
MEARQTGRRCASGVDADVANASDSQYHFVRTLAGEPAMIETEVARILDGRDLIRLTALGEMVMRLEALVHPPSSAA